VHRPDDGRIFHKEVMALRAAGADATVLGLTEPPARARRIAAGCRLVDEARRRRPDVVHIHDPELLPAAWMLRRATGRPVIYDVHEYLGQTTRTKPWIPGRLRRPAAVAVERAERTLARGVDAVVAVTEDMALGFAEAGVRYLDPIVDLSDERLCERQMYLAFVDVLGLTPQENERAVRAGFAELAAF